MSLGSFTMEILALVDAVDVDRLAKDVAVLHDALHERHNLRYVLCYPRERVGIPYSQPVHVVEKLVLPVRGQ